MLLPTCADTASAAGSGSAHAMAYGTCHMCVPEDMICLGMTCDTPFSMWPPGHLAEVLETNYLLAATCYLG